MNSIPEPPPPSLRLRIDTQALADNWRALDRLSGDAAAAAAVKANAYGLGIAQVVPALWQAGARQFYVAHWSEVPASLAHVPADAVSVLHGPISEEDARFARAAGVRPVINTLLQARRWLDAGGGACDLMVDTGMCRLGLAPEDLADEAVARLQVDTLHSHLASADDDCPQNAQQLGRFREAIARVPAKRRSLANSAGIALGADYRFDLTRPGLALYGGVPRSELAPHLRQVAFPQARVLQVRRIGAGDKVGYNATFAAQHEMTIAVVSLGYADGYLRAWSGKGTLECEGRVLQVLGRVSMDLVICDAGQVPELAEGDWLDVRYALPEAAAVSGLSQYELLTSLGSRLERASA